MELANDDDQWKLMKLTTSESWLRSAPSKLDMVLCKMPSNPPLRGDPKGGSYVFCMNYIRNTNKSNFPAPPGKLDLLLFLMYFV